MACSLRVLREILGAQFQNRPNRFYAKAELQGQQVGVYVPNPGSMKELMVPGADLLLEKVETPSRKTRFNLIAVKHGGVLVSIDSSVPNRLVSIALREGCFRQFRGFSKINKEVSFGKSRFDFPLSRDTERCWLEVKS